MEYLGIQTQKRRNNVRSVTMLLLFPCVLLCLTWLFFVIILGFSNDPEAPIDIWAASTDGFLAAAPWVVGLTAIWFLIAYFANTTIINRSTGSQTLDRRSNKRVYNLVENVCMANGMDMPMVNVIEDDSLNAYASGISKKTYTVTLSRGIIDKLNDEELEAVIAHELSHIRNNDVKVLIVSIVFVGIFSFITQIVLRTLFHGNLRLGNDKDKGGAAVLVMMLVVLLLAAIGYLISVLMRFSISRKREFMADAGSAEMTKHPWALASALRKISEDSHIEAVDRKDVAQLFIDNPLKTKKHALSKLFATHPPIEERIAVLEQM